MSFDVYLSTELYDKDGELHHSHEEFHFNYTSNMSSFWKAYIVRRQHEYVGDESIEEDLYGLWALEGLTGEEALPYLKDFFKEIYADIYKDDCNGSVYSSKEKDGLNKLRRKYDAENGWGCMVSAMIVTSELMCACAEYPKAKLWMHS
tara:strand:+ start:128 stop:571 length:444 start_codon:yes stop_codon:yes gene_type:complete